MLGVVGKGSPSSPGKKKKKKKNFIGNLCDVCVGMGGILSFNFRLYANFNTENWSTALSDTVWRFSRAENCSGFLQDVL